MWGAWRAAKSFRCLPSEYLKINDPLTAFYFDRATFTFGTAIENQLAEARQGKGSDASKQMKSKMILAKWLGDAAAGFAKPR